MAKPKSKEPKSSSKAPIILRNGVAYVRRGAIPQTRLRERYHVDLYDEDKCLKCSNRPYRKNDICEMCPALHGQYNFMKDITGKTGERFSAVPSADLEWIKDQFETTPKIKDKRVFPPMKSKLKFTGELFGPGAVDEDGNPRADQKKLVREWMRNKRGIVQAMPRVGKCVVGSTLVNTGAGFRHMRDIAKVDGWHTINGLTVDSHDGQKTVTHTYKERACKTIKVVTREGFSLEGTYEHPVLVLNRDLTTSWTRLEDVREGMFIVSRSSSNSPSWGVPTITHAMARLLGFMTANGDTLGGNRAMFSSEDAVVVAQFTADAHDVLGYAPSVPESGDRVQNYNIGKAGRDAMVAVGYPQKSGAANKVIPKSVLTADRDTIVEYLSAYFACDSGVNRGAVEITSASKAMIDDLHVLLYHGFDLLGVKTKLFSSARNSKYPTTRPYYKIVFSGHEAYKFVELFPRSKVSRNHGHRFKAVSRTHQEGSLFCIPNLPEAVASGLGLSKVGRRITLAVGGEKAVLQFRNGSDELYNAWTDSYVASVNWPVVFQTMRDKGNSIIAERVEGLLSRGEHYAKVTSVRKSKNLKTVYDITVPDGHAFTANGLVSHNTVMAAYIACDLGVRTLWMADRFELLDQAEATFMGDEAMGRIAVTNAKKIEDRKGKPGFVVERVKTLKQLAKSTADVVLINPQKAYLERNMKEFAAAVEGKFGLFVGDEIHMANAKRYAQVVSHVDTPYSLGLSATPGRKDSRDKLMSLVVGPVTAISEVATLKPTIHAFFSQAIPKTQYASWTPAIAWVASDKRRNEEIVDLVFKDLSEGHKSILVPVNYKAHMVLLVDMINKRAKALKMKRDLAVGYHRQAPDRPGILKRANGGKQKTVVVAIMSMVKQGIDLKACSSVIMPIPMSANAKEGAPMFRQLSFRCATPLKGKIAPKVTVIVDTFPMFRGCIRGLFWQEISPRLRGKDALYKMSDETKRKLATMTMPSKKGARPNKAKGSWTRG